MKKAACACLALLLAIACLPLGGLSESPALPYGNWLNAEWDEVMAILPGGYAIRYGSFGLELWAIKSCGGNKLVLEQKYDYGSESGYYRTSWQYALSDNGAALTLRGYTYTSYDENGNEKDAGASNSVSVLTRLTDVYGVWENTEEQITIELKEDGTAVPTVRGEKGFEYLFFAETEFFSVILLNEETGLPENMERFSFILSEDGNTMTITGDSMTYYDEKGNSDSDEYHEMNLVLTRRSATPE